jgi:hypothetical protein
VSQADSANPLSLVGFSVAAGAPPCTVRERPAL